MSRSDDERIADIVEAAQTVRRLVARGRTEYETDPAVRLAIERLLEIIGEAANLVSDQRKQQHPGVPWRDVARFRIVLAHHYHRVDPGQVWSIADVDVPRLLRELAAAAETLVIAVDWSGAARGDGRTGIRAALSYDGSVVEILCGMGREETIRRVGELRSAHDGPTVVGFDFAFGFPQPFAAKLGGSLRGVWSAVAQHGERWLADVPDPFYGKGGKKKPAGSRSDFYRVTEDELAAAGNQPSSVFGLVGGMQVGTGSIRGIPYLLGLEADGWSVWPAKGAGESTVVEIYPAALGTCAPPDWVDRVAVPMPTNDDRDAAMSAIVMWDHRDELLTLRAEPEPYSIEGRIWMPGAGPA